MGQYYLAVNLDKKEYLNAHDSSIFNGIKLMEHSYICNPLMNIITRKLKQGGEWYKTRIVWAGDYAEEGIFIDDESYKNSNLYGYAYRMFENVTDQSLNKNTRCTRYFLNHTKKEYFDISKVKKSEFGFRIHPLPLLTSSGNGNGGGDFRGSDEHDLVGSWAGDVISVSKDEPDFDFDEIIPNFSEYH